MDLRISPLYRSLLACGIFAIAGALGWYFTSDGERSFPLVGYYAILVVNTFFSIKTFAAITPQNTTQDLADIVLVLIYIALAFSFSSVLLFSASSTMLFLVAIGKYVHLMMLITYRNFLRRKIRLNALGASLSLCALALALSGQPAEAAWLLFGLFAVANIYLLAINPMYRLDD